MSFQDPQVRVALENLERTLDRTLEAVGDREGGIPRHAVLMAREGLRVGLGEQDPPPPLPRRPYMQGRDPRPS